MTFRPALLLDLDGTLIDSKAGILASMREALRSLGREPPPEADLTFAVGPPLHDVMTQFLAAHGDTRIEEAITTYRAIYAAGGLFDATLYSGVRELLAAVAPQRDIYLATAKRTAFARRILVHFGIADYFTGIYGSEPGGAVDHKPELIADILARHAIVAEAATMVGDRSYDIAGARANGVRAVGALWGYGGMDELVAADLLAETPVHLQEIIQNQLLP